MRSLLRHLALFVVYGAICSLATLIIVYLYHLQSRPELSPWHTAKLDTEFRATDAASVKTFDDYRRREDALIAEMQAEVYDKVAVADRRTLDRYSAGSRSDPLPLQPNWNRSFELAVDAPRGGAVLLHGASDSPYAMRAIAQLLHARGYFVVGLRLPGHGTAPSGMLDVKWGDWAAAVRIAARHVESRIGPGRPLYLVGYSTGAALAVEYAAARLEGERIPGVAGLVLLSPAIGISPAAAFASVQARLARVPGFEKAAWTDILPEYDPYKYNSFTANVGDQVYLLTKRIEAQFASLDENGVVKGMPRILAFQSVADATVSTPAVVDALFRRLAPEGHALVLFDINRRADIQPLFDPAVLAVNMRLREDPTITFDLTGIVNEDASSAKLVEVRRVGGSLTLTHRSIDLEWPPQMFSLSHTALPFAPDDPVYGSKAPTTAQLIYLGRPEMLGERGLLAVSPTVLMRLRHNPFFSYIERRLDEFLAADSPPSSTP